MIPFTPPDYSGKIQINNKSNPRAYTESWEIKQHTTE